MLGLLESTEQRRVSVAERLVPDRRASFGQFFTPSTVAALLADMFEAPRGAARVLDPGAGVGSLSAALVDRAEREHWPCELDLTSVEIDSNLIDDLEVTLTECSMALPSMKARAVNADFLTWASTQIFPGVFDLEHERYDLVIMNPPYGKMNTSSAACGRLRQLGIRTSNLYSAFVWLAIRLLSPGGQLVAITPRSFCNGTYFKSFRRALLDGNSLRNIHVFDQRNAAFSDDAVLQENIVFRVERGGKHSQVQIATSSGNGLDAARRHCVNTASVVHPDDADRFIRIPEDSSGVELAERIGALPLSFGDLGVTVSTGRVVDFRSRDYLRSEFTPRDVPLIYPAHMRRGRIKWPNATSGKANAIVSDHYTRNLFLPTGNYVLVRRFSAKEERRRVVAAVLERDDLPGEMVAMENRVNVLHCSNAGMERDLAWGMAAYLNSTVVDLFFRQFNGHTQVNASDLRSLRCPSRDVLLDMGIELRHCEFEQTAIDAVVSRHVPRLAGLL
ncbi:Eco57I restriction-modification methylase domain-containing protein [Candidatus Poriferisodalis sp.]|uniref:Eco57I restriction-modification methylase domain-containing protein n=1 Tax=Candidatus Poriferisodalis sp. TaxID=3101277 RepID=UPI003B5A606B